VNSIGGDVVEAREGPQAEEQRVDDDGGAHPQQHQQTQQHAGEQDLPVRGRLDEDHPREGDRLAGREPPALFVKADRKQRPDHHEARESREQDVIETEGEQAGDDGGRHHEHQQAVEKARARLRREIAPAAGEPAERRARRQVPAPDFLTRNRRQDCGNNGHKGLPCAIDETIDIISPCMMTPRRGTCRRCRRSA